jgi:integrase
VKTQNGTLTKRSGKWLGHYSRWLVDSTTGEKKRQQKSYVVGAVEGMTKAEARRALRTKIEQELGLRSDSRVNLKWFIEKRWQPLRESTWRESTKDTNVWVLSHIVKRFGTVPLEDADPVALQLWLNQLAKTYSGSLVRHVRIFLKSIFAEAVEQDYMLKNPARLLRIPTLKAVNRPFLTQKQVKTLLGAAKGMDKIILRLLVATGLRPSELFALEWKHFDAKHKLLRIEQSVYRGKVRDFTKTTDQDSGQTLTQVFLPAEIVTDLSAWRVFQSKGIKDVDKSHIGYDYIFCNDVNYDTIWKENWQQRNLNKIVCRAFHDGKCAEDDGPCKGEGVPKVNFQVLRRTVATHVQGMGSAKDTQTMLRHTKPDTAQINYVQSVEDSVRSAVDKLAATLLG